MFKTLRQMISIPQIEADELRGLIESGTVSVVDANASGRYRKGNIPGAVNVDPAGFRHDQLDVRIAVKSRLRSAISK